MARIDVDKMERISKQRNSVQDLVEASYTTFTEGNSKYFQIETYGRKERKTPGKTSQTLQIDENSARILIDLLQKEFCL